MKSCSDSKPCRKASLPDPWNQLDLSVGSARYLTANGAADSVFPVFPSLASLFSGHAPFITVVQPAHLRYRDDLALPHDPPWLWRILA
jgi:hypothetical protein